MPLHAHSRGVSPENVYRRVMIRMRREAAMPTPIHRLALAALGVNDSTLRTGLACVSSGHLNQCPTSFFELVGKYRLESIPSLVQDQAIKATLLREATKHRSSKVTHTASFDPAEIAPEGSGT